MAATWAELETELIAMLGSAIVHDSDTRKRWINSAMQHFANQHTARTLTVTFNGDGTTRDFVLPSDYIDMYSVYAEQEEMFYEPIPDIPGVAWDTEPDAGLSVRPFAYQEWPVGTLHVTYAPPKLDDSDALVVRYFGHWLTFGDSDEELPPVWAHEAILSMSVAHAYIPSLSDLSFLNEFRTRVDSGNPMHNPIIQAYDKMIERYEYLLSSRPKQIREPFFHPGGRRR